MDFLRQLVMGIGQAWRRLSISARVNVVLAALATIAVVAFMVRTASQPQYVRLFENLDPSETSSIAALLDQESIPYELA
ncbi:MAG: flagellar basal body M-ring protein FliF, partial [Candidatus Hydrogenedentes bacterium]|nr:flagellar basal body M-ring protein FliF [Candidatus Hydrogenedentota bacterium]